MKCPSCNFDLAEGMNFCGNCGASLGEAATRPADTSEEATSPDRRPLTIVFCDLVGSTALSERLDPEELQDLLGHYQEVCSAGVERYDGHVAQYLGDGILVYFGYPLAHEDDARRAIHAGLNIIDSMSELNKKLGRENEPLKVRIGIHTGLVVTGEIGQKKKEKLALGQAPNIAARIQGMTEPNTLAISSDTQRLTEGFFEVESLGTPAMKGVSQSTEVFRVIRETGAKTRLDVAAVGELNRAIGRDEELATLNNIWSLAIQHQRQAVTVKGEAGIGKSRLVAMFQELVREQDANWLVAPCSAYTENSAFAPIVHLLESCFRFERGDGDKEKLRKLEAGLGDLELRLEEVVPVICELLELPVGEQYQPVALPPDQRRQQTVLTINSLLTEISRQKPVVFLVEDLHWADPSTLDLLGQHLNDPTSADILSILTFRPSFEPPWDFDIPGQEIELTRLAEPEIGELIESIVAPRILPDDVIALITERTDGIPLFAEELTRMILESDQLNAVGNRLEPTGLLTDLAVPTTLHSSLVARLDQLGSTRESAQLAAVLGREFSFDMLQSVSDLDDNKLGQRLDRLVDAQVLIRHDAGGQSTYGFRHALIRDAAYDTLLKKDRARHHRTAANVLVDRFPELCETRPELVAHHYTEAGIPDVAIEYWQRAGERATGRFANAEAITHFSRAVSLIPNLPDSIERAQMELTLQAALGLARSIHEGWQSPDAASAYERAYELCQDMPDSPELFWIFWQLGAHYQSHDMAKGHEIALQLVRMAKAAGDPALIVEAQFGLAVGLVLTGKLDEAYDVLQASEELYDGGVDRTVMSPTGQNMAVNNLLYLGMVEFLKGNTEEGRRNTRRAFELASQHAGPPHQAAVLCWEAFQMALNGEWQETLENAEKALPRTTDFFLGRQWASMLRGWALAHKGDAEEAIEQMRETGDTYRATGIKILETFMTMLQADGLQACGEHKNCLEVAAEAIRAGEESGEAFTRAELYRIMGEAQFALGESKAALNSFAKAVEIADKQGAKVLAMKAAASRDRLSGG